MKDAVRDALRYAFPDYEVWVSEVPWCAAFDIRVRFDGGVYVAEQVGYRELERDGIGAVMAAAERIRSAKADGATSAPLFGVNAEPSQLAAERCEPGLCVPCDRKRAREAPSPGPCPTCGTQRRERGEVRVHVWRCGCAVHVPEPVRARGMHGEMIWYCDGGFPPVCASHPTREGAAAAWREAFADAQREEDAS